MMPDEDLRIQYHDDMPHGARIKVIGVVLNAEIFVGHHGQ